MHHKHERGDGEGKGESRPGYLEYKCLHHTAHLITQVHLVILWLCSDALPNRKLIIKVLSKIKVEIQGKSYFPLRAEVYGNEQ